MEHGRSNSCPGYYIELYTATAGIILIKHWTN